MSTRLCLICEKPLYAHLRFYCSGNCIVEAKKRLIYDNEGSIAQKSREPDPVFEAPLHPAFVRATEALRRKGIIK